ncbi:MAG: hypothetical protein Q9186_007678 [Xanthomendoza sp. 1 TL-2023]
MISGLTSLKEPTAIDSAVQSTWSAQAPGKSSSKEALEKRITLPAEQPVLLGAIGEYLYTGNFWIKDDLYVYASRQDKALKLASLYITADKYRLEAMKDTIMQKLQPYHIYNDVSDWLEIANIIYESDPSATEAYPVYLRSHVVRSLDSARDTFHDFNKILERYIEPGGRLALDLHRACNTFWSNKLAKERLENELDL